MATIKVGGLFGPKHIHDVTYREGDVISFKNKQKTVAKEVLDKSFTLDGEGKGVLDLSEPGIAFPFDGNGTIHLKNLTILVGKGSNVVGHMGGSLSLILENIKVTYPRGIDRRDVYPLFVSQAPTSFKVDIRNCEFPQLEVTALSCIVENSKIGDLWGPLSQIYADEIYIDRATLARVEFMGVFKDRPGILHARDLQNEGMLSIKHLTGQLENVVLKSEFEMLNDRQRARKFYDKSFAFETLVMFQLGDLSGPFKILGIQNDIASEVQLIVAQNVSLLLSDGEANHSFSRFKDSEVAFERFEYPSDWVFLNTHVSKGEAGQALEEIDAFIGMDQAKAQLKQLVDHAKINRERALRGLPVPEGMSLHMVMAGNAGTGKTTLARLFAKALYESGVMPTSKFVQVSRKDLVAGYIGQTAPKTHAKIMEALGGVLFIDEAYALKSQGENDFAKEAVAQLIADMEDYRDQLVVILAGYEEDMREFFKEDNQGLTSRFNTWIHFEDYTYGELYQILLYQFHKMGSAVENEVLLDQFFKATIKRLGGLAGNGRDVRNYAQALTLARDSRIAKESDLIDLDYIQITDADIKAGTVNYLKAQGKG